MIPTSTAVFRAWPLSVFSMGCCGPGLQKKSLNRLSSSTLGVGYGISEELLVGDELLRNHPSCSKHREPPVVELAVLHVCEGGGARWLHAEWVEAKVASLVRGLDRPRLEAFRRTVEGEHAEYLDDGDD